MHRTHYRQLAAESTGFWALLGGLAVVVAIGLGSAYYMEHNGHVVTGMTNQVVWGIPHVFAIFLIITASGVLNVASMASVFNKTVYKPLSRLSALLAITMLVAGLGVLVLDLGRPDRLIVAMTTYNFKSIFAWNIFLYTGFLAIVGAYLFVQMDRKAGFLTRPVGWFAFVWRLALTTGTGSIFGWLVARQAYDAAVMAPLFIAMSLSIGLAVFLIVLILAYQWTERPLGDAIVNRLARLLGIFVAVVLYFAAVKHLTNLYAAEHSGVEKFLLWDGGVYTNLFWLGFVILGSLVPMAIVFSDGGKTKFGVMLAAALVIIGGLAELYVIIIGGQAYPLILFPGMEVTSSFYDGGVNEYSPSLWEIGLGLGGVAFSILLAVVAMAVLRFLPEDLSDEALGLESQKPG